MSDALRFTLWGLNQYMPDLFDDVILPPGIDKQTVIDEVMERSGDLYVYYQVPERVKHNIAHWFSFKFNDFERMYRALYADYNPIENYDRHEEIEELPNITRSNSGNDNAHNSSNSNARNESNRSAYDSEGYSKEGESITSASDSTTNSTSYSSKQTETGNRVTKNHTHGNIGITTNQQMINAELDLRRKSLYEYIAEEFENKFLIQVY